MPQPLVLAIEPDLRQAAIVKRIVREKALADVAVVDSLAAAIEAIRTSMPDVLLLSALLSPRDEDDLITHLKTLGHAGHLQTHTIPQLASALQPGEDREPRGLLSAFRRRKGPAPVAAGCDPDLFADEIRVFLQRAADKKREMQNPDHETPDMRPSPAGAAPASRAHAESPSTPSSSWSSPFEWKPSNPSSLIADPESLISNPESLIGNPESLNASPKSSTASGSLMAHLTPPAGVPPLSRLTDTAQERPVVEPGPTVVQQATQVQDSTIQDSRIEGSRIPDSRSGIQDPGLGIRDQRSGIRDKRLGAVSSWARAEPAGRDATKKEDGLCGLLTGLAVPASVVAVGYGRGCRIRRVRVPAAREPQQSEVPGAVIVSKRLLAEQRERPGA